MYQQRRLAENACDMLGIALWARQVYLRGSKYSVHVSEMAGQALRIIVSNVDNV
jgi:hypothetical protein